jgi:hypothetical protein
MEGAAVTVEHSLVTTEFFTDENGHFRIGGLAPGKYRVRARGESGFMQTISVPPEIRADGSVEVHNAATYYPGVLTAKQAAKVEVKPGEETTDIDVQLLGVPFVKVSGKAVGKPLGARQAYADVNMQGFCCPGVMLDAEGKFEIWGLDPGKYTVRGRWEDAAGEETLIGRILHTAPVTFEVSGSNIDNLELHVVPDFDIAGQLQFETPDGTEPLPERNVMLGRATAPVGADDTFRLEKVPAGKYVVSLSWDTVYIKSMQLGSRTIDGAMLDLSNGSAGAPLTLLLSAATGSISGIIRDDKGNPVDARVVLVRDDETGDFRARYATAKRDGVYSFPNLPPGNYKLLAVPEDDADVIAPRIGATEPELSDYEDELEKVEVRTGEKVSRDLTRQAGE